MYTISSFLVCSLATVFLAAANLPLVHKCSAEDTKCQKQSAQTMIPIIADGIPQFEMQSLDPLVLDQEIDASSLNLKLLVKNMVVTGLRGCVAKKVERDLEKSKLHTRLVCNVRAEGHYEMHGRLLVLPIEGKGASHVYLNKIQIDVDNEMNDRTGRDGKKHWHIKSTRFHYELKDKAVVKFENLFNGNEVLARAAKEIIATNANEIVTEVGPPIVGAIVDKIVQNVNRFFKAMPAEDIALD